MAGIIARDANGQLWNLIPVSDANGISLTIQPAAPGSLPSITLATSFTGTYKVADAFNLAKKLAKGIPFTGVDTTICDLVSARIYKAYPWHDTLATIPAGTIPLANNVQDYNGFLLMRPTQFWLVRTDVTPNVVRDVRVAKNLSIDLQAKSPYSIQAAAYQAGGIFRLESAVRIASGEQWELRGEFQPHPVKITDLQNPLWFGDEFLEVFAKGLAYWAYRLSDDSRAGEMSTDDSGHARYTGMLGEFVKDIADMAAEEDFGNIDCYYPDDSIGAVDARRYSNQNYPLI